MTPGVPTRVVVHAGQAPSVGHSPKASPDTQLAALEDQDAEHSTGAPGQPSPGPCSGGSAIPDRPIGARTVARFTGQRAISAVRASTGAGCARALGTQPSAGSTATPEPISRSDCLTVALSLTVSQAVADAADRPYVPRGAGIVAELAPQDADVHG